MFISVLIGIYVCNVIVVSGAFQCNQDTEYANYMSCLNKWRVVREYTLGHSAFLKDVTLIDEICILPGSPTVKEMDACVNKAVSPFCEAIVTHWKGLRQFATFLCQRREAFEGKYARCRTDVGFQSAYENCLSTNVQQINTGQDNCRSYRQLERCLKNALTAHCSKRAAEFFGLAFSARDVPLIAYSCKKEKEVVPEYMFNVQVDSRNAENKQNNDKQSTDTSSADSRYTEVAEENLAVDAVNESNNSNIMHASPYLIIFSYLLRLFSLRIWE